MGAERVSEPERIEYTKKARLSKSNRNNVHMNSQTEAACVGQHGPEPLGELELKG